MKSLKVLAVMAVLAGFFVFAGNTAAAQRFVNNGNGTVTDTQTGLMWADKDNGANINWSNAKIYCEGYSGGGKSGWRMPTIDELRQLYNYGAYGSVITRTKTGYVLVWSSETSGSDAAVLEFSRGNRFWDPQSNYFETRVLPVRSGN